MKRYLKIVPTKNLASSGEWKLDNPEDYKIFISKILEELFEITGQNIKWNDPAIDNIVSKIMENENIKDVSMENVLNAMADIAMHSIINIHFFGYDPEIIIDETRKEVESREGSIIDGKFNKFLDEKYTKKWYIPNYNKAKYKN